MIVAGSKPYDYGVRPLLPKARAMDIELSKVQKAAMLALMGADGLLDQMSDDDIADLVREQPKDWSDTLKAHTAKYMPDPIWVKRY